MPDQWNPEDDEQVPRPENDRLRGIAEEGEDEFETDERDYSGDLADDEDEGGTTF